jgi:hypothetical protein
LAVHDYRAGSAFPFGAIFLRTSNLQLLSENFKQGKGWRASYGHGFPVKLEVYDTFNAHRSFPSACLKIEKLQFVRNLGGSFLTINGQHRLMDTVMRQNSNHLAVVIAGKSHFRMQVLVRISAPA